MDFRRISLNGEWIGRGLDEHDQWIQFTGVVPGCVHTDFIREKIIDYDIYWRDNHKRCQWIEKKSFTYERHFILDEKMFDKGFAGAKLVFEGLDTYCDIYLNEKHLGSCDNMFISYTFEVEKHLQFGENKLEVVFLSPLFTEQKKKRAGAFTTERLYTRRMQCTYGWDWVARFVTMGIFKDVYLSFGNDVSISHTYLYTKEADEHSAQVIAEICLENYEKGAMLEIELQSPDGEIVYHNARYCRESMIKEYLDVMEPKRWYPNGYGEQPLYRFIVKIEEKIVQEEVFGIVTSRILREPDKKGSSYYQKCMELKKTVGAEEYDHNEEFSGFELLVNGIGVMCKGADWVPCEPFPSAESREKIAKILRMARDAGVNMLRVWGGGIFEQDFFYEECDRLGIMVTQDFLMACGEYPEDEKWFLEALKEEAKCAALRLRNHPCLMWWTGDNENAVKGSDEEEAFPGRTASLQAIFPVLNQYDPQRRFLISSPWGGDMYASKTVGTTHNTQFLGEFFTDAVNVGDYKEYLKEFTARFIAEEPSLGAAERKTLRHFMTDEDILETEDMWLSHTKTNPALERELFEYSKLLAENLFGRFKDGEDRLIKLQYLQYEWIRISMENARRNKGFCNGILYWMLNDCWPAASGWALIDYYNYPKAAYYSFKRSAKDVITSINREEDKLKIYICNDSLNDQSMEMKVSILNYKTNVVSELSCRQLICPKAKSTIIEEIPTDVLKDQELLVCELRSKEKLDLIDRSFYKKGTLSFEESIPPEIVERSCDSVTIRANQYTHIVRLEGDCEFEDNYFSLMSGEERTLRCSGDISKLTVTGYALNLWSV